jgi:hypothetical protein
MANILLLLVGGNGRVRCPAVAACARLRRGQLRPRRERPLAAVGLFYEIIAQVVVLLKYYFSLYA